MIATARRAHHRELPRVTTPSVLRVALGGIGAVLVCVAVLGTIAVAEQQRAAERLAGDAAATLASAEGLYVALADADAAASTTYLQAGQEPPQLRARYVEALDEAGGRLAEVGTDPYVADRAGEALATIERRRPVYAGFVERARADNRRDLPVSDASLRTATLMMRDEIIPAATAIYVAAASAVDADQRVGASADAVIVLAVGGVVLLVGLVATQVFVTVRTRRYVNVWLLAATLVTIGAGVVVGAGLVAQRDAVVRSRQHGSDPLLALGTARILALRSMNDQNLDLIGSGTDDSYAADFADVSKRIAGPNGLLDVATAARIDDRAPARITQIAGLHRDYLGVHARVEALLEAGRYLPAVSVATGEQADRAAMLDDAIAAELTVTRAAFDRHAGDAGRWGWWVVAALLGGAVLVGALSAIGVRMRLREYR